MVLVMKVSTVMDLSRGDVDICFMTDQFTLVSSIKSLWMAKEFTLGLMEENMRGSTLKAKGRGMEFLHGPMVVSTMETGKTERNTAQES